MLDSKATTLKIDVPTRWNSSYDMIERFLSLQEAVVGVIRCKELSGLKEKDVTSLTDEEVIAAEEMVKFLKPMKDITVTLSYESIPTASLVMPLYANLIGPNGHLSIKDDDSDLISMMKRVLKADLDCRYESEELKLSMISAMDPRFKHLSFLPDDKKHLVYSKIPEEAVKFQTTETSEGGNVFETGHSVKVEPTSSQVEPPPLPKSESERPNVVEAKCLLDELLGVQDCVVTGVEAPKSPIQRACEEATAYRNLPKVANTIQPLEWWKHNANSFPMLSPLARALLSVPATSVSSERAFSTAGDIVTAQRASLKPNQVDMLLFLKKNS